MGKLGAAVAPAVVRLPSGEFLVVTNATNLYGTSPHGDYALLAVKYSSEGVKISESQLTSPWYRYVEAPDLAVSQSGSIVLTYAQSHISHGSHIHLVGDGLPSYVTSGPYVYRFEPEVVVLNSGNTVVSYMDTEGGVNTLIAKMISPSGAFLGDPIQVAQGSISDPAAHKMIALPNGGFAIVHSETSTGLDVVVRIYDQNGAKTSEFVANTSRTGDQVAPDIAVTKGGQLVVVWQDNHTSGAVDSSGTSIKAQLFDLQGSKIGEEFVVNHATFQDQITPSVLALSSGGFVVAWADSSGIGADSSGYAVKAQVFNADLSRAGGTEFLVNTTTVGDQTAPILVETAYGRFAVIWQDSNDGIQMQVFSPSRFVGSDGNDTYVVDDAADVVVELANGGNDTIFSSVSYILSHDSHVEVLSTLNHADTSKIDLAGNRFNNTLFGNAGDNLLNGRGGADLMIGYAGNDVYSVDDVGDVIVEAAGQGLDTVFSSIDYTLAADAHVEVLSAISHSATTPLSLTGNGLANTIYGNAGNNVLNGGGGADFLIGFGGDDVYYIDHGGDYIVEGEEQGRDTVFTSIDYTLTGDAHVEVLSTIDHAATTAISITGNIYSNTIFGNAGNNVLNGGGGADFLIGFGGDDIYYVDNAGDYIVEGEGQGRDTLFTSIDYDLTGDAHVEVISTIDHAATTAINLAGNMYANTIWGNAGANVINGDGGSDLLFGLGGADTFVFDTPLGPTNIDTIIDFVAGVDKVALSSSVFTQLAPGALAPGAFAKGSQAADADDRIIYNPDTGALLYDPDGSGGAAAIHFATLSAGLPMESVNFVVV